MAALKDSLMTLYFERASYYDNIARRPQSALIAYTDFITRFPAAKQAALVNDRIDTLKAQLDKAKKDE